MYKNSTEIQSATRAISVTSQAHSSTPTVHQGYSRGEDQTVESS